MVLILPLKGACQERAPFACPHTCAVVRLASGSHPPHGHLRDPGLDREGPSVRQIGEWAGLSSTSSVAYQLGRLEARGLISRTGHRWRSCRLST
ncbi:hypothetical protein ACFU9X_35320 [Streptomyces atratus]|uniref:LexA family protein n=1 Tax=Streptomyces atratus TaxID=1893 RepID=UPI00368A4EA9